MLFPGRAQGSLADAPGLFVRFITFCLAPFWRFGACHTLRRRSYVGSSPTPPRRRQTNVHVRCRLSPPSMAARAVSFAALSPSSGRLLASVAAPQSASGAILSRVEKGSVGLASTMQIRKSREPANIEGSCCLLGGIRYTN